jgi:hypothetical protein
MEFVFRLKKLKVLKKKVKNHSTLIFYYGVFIKVYVLVLTNEDI